MSYVLPTKWGRVLAGINDFILLVFLTDCKRLVKYAGNHKIGAERTGLFVNKT